MSTREFPGSAPGISSGQGRDETSKSSDFTIKAPSISIPKGSEAIKGISEKLAAYAVTVTDSMTVPITTSPGLSGLGHQWKKKEKNTTGESVRLQKMRKKGLKEEKILLDVQTPEIVVEEKPFEISVAVRQLDSPFPEEPGIPKVASKPGKIFRETSEDIVKYRGLIRKMDY